MTGSNDLTRSELQDALFDDFFGFNPFITLRDLDSSFNDAKNDKDFKTSFYERKAYTDGKGNLIVKTNDNGKCTVETHPNFNIPSKCNNKLPPKLGGYSDFPQASGWIDKDKNEIIQVNIAGIEADRIHLSYKDENLYIKIDEAPATDEHRDYFLTGLKDCSRAYERYFYINPAYVNIKKMTKEIKNGYLTITIPKADSIIAGELEYKDGEWVETKPAAEASKLEESTDEAVTEDAEKKAE